MQAVHVGPSPLDLSQLRVDAVGTRICNHQFALCILQTAQDARLTLVKSLKDGSFSAIILCANAWTAYTHLPLLTTTVLRTFAVSVILLPVLHTHL